MVYVGEISVYELGASVFVYVCAGVFEFMLVRVEDVCIRLTIYN